MAGRVLIVEDDAQVAAWLEDGLRAHGFATTVAADGLEATALAEDDGFDLIVLDLDLRSDDAFAVLEHLRRRAQPLPVIVLGGQDGVEETVAGLDSGAADFVTKPFRFDELLARVRVLLRQGAAPDPTRLTAGSLVLDLRTRRVEVADHSVELTGREFALLEIFLRHRGRVLSRGQLLSRVWGLDPDVESNVVDVYVGYLRRKLGNDAIETVRGLGYRLPNAAPNPEGVGRESV